MDPNRWKSHAAADILSKSTNVHFINPQTRKIDLNMLNRCMHKKNEHAEFAAASDFVNDSSDSDIVLLSQKSVEHFNILFQSKKIIWAKSGNG